MFGFAISTTLGRTAPARATIIATRNWTPADLGSAVAWWDAEKGITLAGTGVARWIDRIGGQTVTQSAASAQPAFDGAARNGKAGLVFGSGQFLTGGIGALPVAAKAHTLLVAAHATGADRYNATVLSWGARGTNASRSLRVRGAHEGVIMSFYSNDYNGAASWSGRDRTVAHQMDDQGNGLFWADGLADSPHQVAGVETGATVTNIGTHVQNTAHTVNGMTVQQIVIASAVLSTTDRQRLEGWASWHTGRGGRELSADHPHRNARPQVAA